MPFKKISLKVVTCAGVMIGFGSVCRRIGGYIIYIREQTLRLKMMMMTRQNKQRKKTRPDHRWLFIDR